MEFEVLRKLADEVINSQRLLPVDVWDSVTGRIQLRPEITEMILRLVTRGTRITWSDVWLINRTMDVHVHSGRLMPETTGRLRAPHPYADVALRLAITIAEQAQAAAMQQFASFADGVIFDLGLEAEVVRDSDGKIMAAEPVATGREGILPGGTFSEKELQVSKWNSYPRLNSPLSKSTREALKRVPVKYRRAVQGLMLYIVFRAEGTE